MRVLLKLSGEALSGDKGFGFSSSVVKEVAKEVKKLHDNGTQISVVIGGGNFWRGRTGTEINRSKADQIGMMATIMNAIYVSDVFSSLGMETSIYTPFSVGAFTKLYSLDEVKKDLNDNKIVFFAGGTGHPYFSTDTGAALRAIETESDMMLLAKAVDGVYDSDPKINPNAKKYETISLKEIVNKNLKVIDMTASILCMENKMPLKIFALNEKNGILNAVNEKLNGTTVTV